MARWTCSHSPPFLRLVLVLKLIQLFPVSREKLAKNTVGGGGVHRILHQGMLICFCGEILRIWWKSKLTYKNLERWIPLLWLPSPQKKLLRWNSNVGRWQKKDRIPWNDIFIGWVPQCLHPTSQQSQQIKRSTTMCIHCKVNSLSSLDFINQLDLQVHPRLRCDPPKQLEEDVPRKLPSSSSELKKSQY